MEISEEKKKIEVMVKEKIEEIHKEIHKEIIEDICLIINNCAECFNDEIMQVDCCPLQCVELYDITADSFYIDCYFNLLVELADIAFEHGYGISVTKEEGIKFWKIQKG